MKKFALIAVVFVLVAVPAFASHGWGSYHWGRPCSASTGCEAQITVYSSLTVSNTDWPGRLNRAIYGDAANPNTANRRGWNDSSVLALSVAGAATDSSTRYSCPAVSNAVRVCNYSYGANGWLGLAQINTVSGTTHIAWGTAKMNDSYFASGYPGTEKQHVMCQEVGHDFGLGHTSENGSSQNTCMDYYQNTSSSDWTSTGPNQHDFDQLLTQHHATAITSPTFTFLNAVAVARDEDNDLSEPWQWGTPFEWDDQGRPSGFELDLGDRNVYTFVHWTDERDQRIGGRLTR